MGTAITSAVVGGAVSTVTTFGFYKAVLQRAVKDIADLRTGSHSLRNFIVEYQREVDRVYARKEAVEKDLAHIKDTQSRIEDQQGDIAADVKSLSLNMTQLVISVAKLGVNSGV